MIIYAPANYVGVYIRERWVVIPIEDLDVDGDGETCVKPDKDYIRGEEPWRCVAYHDSGWSEDGVGHTLLKNRDRIVTFDGHLFYQVLDVTPELEKTFEKALADKRRY